MKVFGAGSLTNRLDVCLKYHLDNKNIDATTIGVESLDQFNDLLKRIPKASV
jgi:hypothetical protein